MVSRNTTHDRSKKSGDVVYISGQNIMLICLGILVVIFQLGNIIFYVQWLGCGHKPYEGSTDLIVESAIQPPWYKESKTFQLYRNTPPYFCTPLEAERAGYSASQNYYDFPHLKKDNSQ